MSKNRELGAMTISLPIDLKGYVQAQAAASGCATPSEYIRRLIHADQKARGWEQLEQRLLESLAAGEAMGWTPEDWEELRLRLRTAQGETEMPQRLPELFDLFRTGVKLAEGRFRQENPKASADEIREQVREWIQQDEDWDSRFFAPASKARMERIRGG